MRIGVTGHQDRAGINWTWVKDTIREELTKIGSVKQGLSALAVGSDQVFADVVLGLGVPVLAVIPVWNYERYFDGEDLANYRRFLSECEVMYLNRHGDDEQAFLEAGKIIVEKSDMIFAIWDGKQAEGQGGTGDIVVFAQEKAKPVLQINPIIQTIQRI